MPAIDYSQYNAQASSAGRRAGKAQGELKRQQDELERKQRLEQRYAQLAKDKQMHDNELARTEYVEAVKAQAFEANDFAESQAKGWIDGEGMYTNKYFEDKAFDEWANSGISRSSEDETIWRTQGGMQSAIDQLRSGHAKYKTRTYRKIDAEDLYRQQLEFNQRVAEKGMERRAYSSGAQGAGERLGDRLVDSIFGSNEPDQRPTQEVMQDPRAQERFETTDTGSTTVDYSEPEQVTLEPITDAWNGAGERVPNVVFAEQGTPDGQGAGYYQAIAGENGVEYRPVNITTQDPLTGEDTRDRSIKDVQDSQIDIEQKQKLSEAQKVITVASRLSNSLNIETGSTINRLKSWAATFTETEFLSQLGSKEERDRAMEEIGERTLQSWKIAAGEEKAPSEADMKLLRSQFASMDQDTLTLAYALVKLNRAGQKFNGQELAGQLALLADNSPADRLAAIKRAVEDAKSATRKTAIDIAARDFQKVGYSQYGISITDGQFKGQIDDVEYFPDGGMQIKYRENSPLEFTIMRPNGGINHHLRGGN